MRILNLADLEKSDIKYKISKFPDGQQDIVLDTSYLKYSSIYDVVHIKSRLNSFLDLELIICATKALRRLQIKEIFLFIPYVLGARSDRQFQEGGTSYLVDVIAPIINSLNFSGVTVLDVHSDVAAACINNLGIVDNTVLVKEAFTLENRECVLVSPDAGALKKIYTLAKNTNFKGDIIVASKHRDLDGKITHTEVPIKIEYANKDFIIIDDICDGGRTFIEIAKVLQKHYPESKLYLIVTHGIFSNGLKELCHYFDHIYTTNSVMDVNIDTEFNIRNGRYLHKLTQINVF